MANQKQHQKQPNYHEIQRSLRSKYFNTLLPGYYTPIVVIDKVHYINDHVKPLDEVIADVQTVVDYIAPKLKPTEKNADNRIALRDQFVSSLLAKYYSPMMVKDGEKKPNPALKTLSDILEDVETVVNYIEPRESKLVKKVT